MKSLILAVAFFLVAGCGATYNLSRTSPDGTTVTAAATVMEKQGSMVFSFDGDPAGAMKITLEKKNAEPVNMPAELAQTLMKLAQP
jgi:uncharacterized lipoprotein YajG